MTIPKSYRELSFDFMGKKNVVVSGLAHPIRYNSSDDLTINYLKERGVSTLISLDETKYEQNKQPHHEVIRKKWISHNKQHIHFEFKDFTAPSLEMYENFFHIVYKNIQDNAHIAIHCGEGFGRTGTMLAALAVYELIEYAYFHKVLLSIKSVLSNNIQSGNSKLRCSPIVVQAIEKVRNVIGGERSVETQSQVDSLVMLERVFLYKFKKYLIEKSIPNQDNLFDLSGYSNIGLGYESKNSALDIILSDDSESDEEEVEEVEVLEVIDLMNSDDDNDSLFSNTPMHKLNNTPVEETSLSNNNIKKPFKLQI